MSAPVTISEEAKALLAARMASSGFKRPVARIAMNMPAAPAKQGDEDDVDWTVRRRDLWAVRIEEGEGASGIVLLDGMGFVCDFFPMRFDIAAKDGHFRVAAAA